MPDVYLLKDLAEEVISHAFAKTSRAPGTFREMVKELTADKSAKFHEKWVLGFGHSSVSEHTVLHVAVEGVSRLAIEVLESGRLASYTEQSTRYQPMRRENVYQCPTWTQDFLADFDASIDDLFKLYHALERTTREHGSSFSSPVKGYDLARFALPLATKVNVGMTINARSLRRIVCKMLAHHLKEVRDLAEQLASVGLEQAPTLLKHIQPCLSTINVREMDIGAPHSTCSYDDDVEASPISVRCIKFDVDEHEIRHALAYGTSNLPFSTHKVSFHDMFNHLNEIGEHDAFARAFELGRITFEVVSDYGSFYDMKRHRMATIIPQMEVGVCGFVVPQAQALRACGIYDSYRATMLSVEERFKKYSQADAVYMLPNAFRKRYVISVNPREMFEVVKLRGINPGGHSSYRAIGLAMLEECIDRCPSVFEWMRKWLPTNTSHKTMAEGYELVR